MGGIIISKNRQMIKSQQQKLGAWRSKKAKSRSGSDDHPPPATDSQDNTMTTILLSHEIQRPKDPMITRGLSDAISAQEYARLGFEEFSPSLIIVPPNAIPEIYNELRKFFPDLIIYVYYYVTGPQWRGPKPRSVWSRQLKYYLAQWKRENYLPKVSASFIVSNLLQMAVIATYCGVLIDSPRLVEPSFLRATTRGIVATFIGLRKDSNGKHHELAHKRQKIGKMIQPFQTRETVFLGQKDKAIRRSLMSSPATKHLTAKLPL